MSEIIIYCSFKFELQNLPAVYLEGQCRLLLWKFPTGRTVRCRDLRAQSWCADSSRIDMVTALASNATTSG